MPRLKVSSSPRHHDSGPAVPPSLFVEALNAPLLRKIQSLPATQGETPPQPTCERWTERERETERQRQTEGEAERERGRQIFDAGEGRRRGRRERSRTWALFTHPVCFRWACVRAAGGRGRGGWRSAFGVRQRVQSRVASSLNTRLDLHNAHSFILKAILVYCGRVMLGNSITAGGERKEFRAVQRSTEREASRSSDVHEAETSLSHGAAHGTI